jgi:hypothetical protein
MTKNFIYKLQEHDEIEEMRRKKGMSKDEISEDEFVP